MNSIRNVFYIFLILGIVSPTWAADSPLRTLTVRGESIVEIEPDFVEMTFNVIEKNNSVLKAKERVDIRINAVITALQKFTIANDDISMSGVEVNQSYKYDRNDNENFDGYEALRKVTIKLRNILDYEALTSELVKGGVGNLEQIESGIDDEGQITRAALEAAARDARIRAEAITHGLGVELGSPIEVGENQLRPLTRFEQRNATGRELEEISITASRRQVDLPPLFVPNKIQVSGVVWVVFELQSE